jgi:plastocyanin
MRNIGFLALVIALASCSGGAMGSHAGVPNAPQFSALKAHAGTNWTVLTGGASKSYAFQALDYYPNSITIDAGDTVTFTVQGGAGGDAHTVAFVPASAKMPSPLDPKDSKAYGGTTVTGKKILNSGILLGGQTFTLKFPVQGTYRIVCLFHNPAMQGTVVVQKAGTPYPHTAAYYRRLGASQLRADLSGARASVREFPFPPGGTTIAAGIAPQLVQYPPTDLTVLRFLNTRSPAKATSAGNLTVKVNTVMTFVNETANEPHTVSINIEGKSGVPRIPPDPPVNAAPHGRVTTDDGTKVVNSGTFLGGQSFRVMFTKAGTYAYGCVYHFNSGMDGTITVTP